MHKYVYGYVVNVSTRARRGVWMLRRDEEEDLPRGPQSDFFETEHRGYSMSLKPWDGGTDGADRVMIIYRFCRSSFIMLMLFNSQISSQAASHVWDRGSGLEVRISLHDTRRHLLQ
jgi:hypothetical protein